MNLVTKYILGGMTAAALTAMAGAAPAGEKWDMPLAYAATNYHSENAAAFAAAVTDTSPSKPVRAGPSTG